MRSDLQPTQGGETKPPPEPGAEGPPPPPAGGTLTPVPDQRQQLSIAVDGRTNSLRGKVGDGPSIRLKANHGSVSVRDHSAMIAFRARSCCW